MDFDNIDKTLLAKAVNFHGLQLQKIFETEYSNFQNLRLEPLLDFNEYSKRQKNLSFQDRGKRFHLQQFIGKHADKLFSKNRNVFEEVPKSASVITSQYCPVMPPFEWFWNVDKESRSQRFFEYIKEGDLIVGSVLSKTAPGLFLKILYGECDEIRCVTDLNIKAFCPTATLIPAVDKKTETSRAFLLSDLICCEVLEVNKDTEKIICGMKGTICLPLNQPRLGLMNSEDFAPVYRKFLEKKRDATYNSLLGKQEAFYNANFVDNLLKHLNLPDELSTHFNYLKEKFPAKEYALELRQAQASKWSFRGVAEGIEHFKAGRFTEAFQCLNKALTIDPRNIEALVARGALYANSSNYEKAISDFKIALKYNPSHQNAKKYLGDTLIAYGRSHEENFKFEEAATVYENCLQLIPNHEEAKNSLQYIRNKLSAPKEMKDDSNLLGAEKIRELCTLFSKGDEKTFFREMKKLRKKRTSSSSSSSSSSNSSRDSSNESSSSSESSKKKKRSKRQASLSPLSKRMALMESNPVTEGFQPFVQPVTTYNPNLIQYSQQGTSSLRIMPENEGDLYEMRVRQFLEETKKGDFYEEQVRKFLEETAKWRRKKGRDIKKKKKKKEIKVKRKKKEVKKKKSRKDEKKHKKRSSGSEFLDTPFTEKHLNLNSLKDLEELQTKLSAYYSKVEKASSKSKKDKHKDKDERVSKLKHSNDEEIYAPETPKRLMDKPKAGSYNDSKTSPEPRDAGAFKFKMQVSHRENKVRKRDEEDPFWGADKNITDDELENSVKANTKRSLPPPGLEMSLSAVVSDKHRGYSKGRLPSPKRDHYRSKSRSKSLRRSRYRSRSPSRRRYSRSRSRSRSFRRRRFSRSSRSRSFTRSRSRTRSHSRSRTRSRSYSPFHRSRNFQSRGRGTYYRPREWRGSPHRGSSWRSNYNGRSRGFVPRSRPNTRRPYRSYANRNNDTPRDYRHRRSSEEITEWRDSSRERSRERSEKRSDDENRSTLSSRFGSSLNDNGEPSAPGTEPSG